MLELLAVAGGLLLLVLILLVCRIWRRNRYYKKVQHSLDEEERAFQETLARSYQEDAQLDGDEREKLRMLETYMSMQTPVRTDDEIKPAEDAEMPSRAEDVDKFMAELAAAAAGGTLPVEDAAEGDEAAAAKAPA